MVFRSGLCVGKFLPHQMHIYMDLVLCMEALLSQLTEGAFFRVLRLESFSLALPSYVLPLNLDFASVLGLGARL